MDDAFVTQLFWQLETGSEQDQVHAADKLAALAFQLHAHSGNLIKRLKHPRAKIRRQAAATLGMIYCRDAVDALIDRATHDRSDVVRLEAFQALSRIRDRRAVAPLTRLLMQRNTPSESVRAAIIAALGAIGDERAMIPLLAQLNTTNEHIRQVTIQAMNTVLDEKAGNALWRKLETEPDPRAKIWAFLLQMPKQASRPMVEKIRRDDADMTFEDVTFFADMETHNLTQLLLAGLYPDVPTDARLMVLQLIAIICDRDALPAVCDLLQDPIVEVRKQALRTLAVLGDKQAVRPVLKLAQTERWNDVLLEAVITLAKLGDPNAVPLLQDLMAEMEHSTHEELRFAVWLAIERLCNPEEEIV